MSKGCRLRLVHGRCLQRVETGDAVANLVEETVDLEIDSDTDRIGEAVRVGAAMALDADSLQSQEDRAVVAARVEAVAQLAQRVCREPVAEPCRERALECGAQEVESQTHRPFRRLERDIAGEAVGYDHVDGTGADIVAFDEAVEAD